jgi:hypothetical protein
MPGVAISVAPSGIPAGTIDPAVRGDVVEMLNDGCMEDVICAMTEAGDDEPVPAASDTRMNKK